MTAEDLRRGFERLTAPVVPVEDPYGRLLRRVRRRRARRFGAITAGLTALLAATTSIGLAVGQGATGHHDPNWPAITEWTRRLIDSPTRGNLAGDTALLSGIVEQTRAIAPGLPETKVLFVADVGHNRVAVVAHRSAEHATIDSYIGRVGASAGDLVQNGTLNMPVQPVAVVTGDDATAPWTVVLAPSGCEVSTSTRIDGGARNAWVPSSDGSLLVSTTAEPPYVRVACGGTVRQQGPTAPIDEVGVQGPAQAPQRGTADPATVRLAVGAFTTLASAAGAFEPANVVWAGRIPDDSQLGEVVVVAAADGSGPAVLWAGADPKASVAREPALGTSSSASSRSLAATGVASNGVIGVRVPRWSGTGAVLGPTMLVIAPGPGVRAEAFDPSGASRGTAALVDGVGVIPLGEFGPVVVRVTDSAGSVIATASIAEPASGPRLFDEPLINAW